MNTIEKKLSPLNPADLKLTNGGLLAARFPIELYPSDPAPVPPPSRWWVY